MNHSHFFLHPLGTYGSWLIAKRTACLARLGRIEICSIFCCPRARYYTWLDKTSCGSVPLQVSGSRFLPPSCSGYETCSLHYTHVWSENESTSTNVIGDSGIQTSDLCGDRRLNPLDYRRSFNRPWWSCKGLWWSVRNLEVVAIVESFYTWTAVTKGLRLLLKAQWGFASCYNSPDFRNFLPVTNFAHLQISLKPDNRFTLYECGFISRTHQRDGPTSPSFITQERNSRQKTLNGI